MSDGDFLTTERKEFLDRRVGVIEDMDDRSPDANWIRVLWTYQIMHDAGREAAAFPGAITLLIETRAWETYQFQGQVLQPATFRDFVEAEPPGGLGSSVDEIVRKCKIEPVVVDMIDQILEAQEPAHRPKKKTTDSVSSSNEGKRRSAGGNSFQHGIRKLRHLAVDLPYAAELRRKVFEKEISVNHALVLLGIRPKMVSVVATWEGFANGARNHLELEDIAELVSSLSAIFK